MNIQELHPEEKPLSALTLFEGKEGITKSMHLAKGAELPRHITKTPALLICVMGEVLFENENGIKEILKQGDYVNIEPMVNHWANGIENSYLLLIK